MIRRNNRFKTFGYTRSPDVDGFPPHFSMNLENGVVKACNCIGHAIGYSKATNKRLGRNGLFVACAYKPQTYFVMLDMTGNREGTQS